MRITLFLFLLSLFGSIQAQNHPHEVNDMIQQNQWYEAHPELWNEIDRLEKQLESELEFYQKHSSAKRGEQYLIPVVFHILHQGGPENISDEQVQDAVDILTRDFNFRNPDTADIIPQFRPIAGNPEISFRLAKKDPFGNPTNGITRTFTSLTENAGEGSKIISWPREKYLNIWVVNSIASGAAGYTYYPFVAQNLGDRDGIIILQNYVGSIGTGNARRSRALTHEIGHWINLPHVWGSTNNPAEASNCSSDDGVSDTPNTIGWRSCNLNGETCGSLDNVQNYMDYSYCYTMFTKGQSDRMRAALTSNVADRSNLITVENHRATGVIDYLSADFESNKRVICEGESVTFSDKSSYDQSSWDWKFNGGNPSSSNSSEPVIQYNSAGLYNVRLSIGDGVREDSTVLYNEIYVLPSQGLFTPYTEDFESESFANQLWKINNEFNQGQGVGGWEYSGSVSQGGARSLVNRNYGTEAGRTDEYISTTFDWSSFESAIVQFSLAFRQRAQDNNDRLKIYISNDCGETWKLRWVKSGAELATGQPRSSYFIPSSSDWVEHQLTNFPEADLVDNVILKFVFESDGGNELYIDDLLIAGVYKNVPVLNFPMNESTNIDQETTLDWKPIYGVSGYEYEIDTDTSFSSSNYQSAFLDYISIEPYNSDTEVELDLTPGQTYYWRVRSYFNADSSDWSKTWSFTISQNGEGDTLTKRVVPEKILGSIELKEDLDFKVYPNPLTDNNNLFLRFNHATSGHIQIYNAMGQLLQTSSFQDQSVVELEASDLPKGVLWIQVNEDSRQLNRTLIVR